MAIAANILLIDADADRSTPLADALQQQGCSVTVSHRRFDAIDQANLQSFNLLLCQAQLPDGDWQEVVSDLNITPHVIFHPADTPIDAAMHALCNDLSSAEKSSFIMKLLDPLSRNAPPAYEAKVPANAIALDNQMVANSVAMQKVTRMALRAAKTKSSILITGATGTGKEVMAQLIHSQSDRAALPFVAINCGAIPEELLESELFGHSKGAFTGATQSRKGRFQIADKGTIFLDEIGDMSPKLQVKLLRVLQERCFEPVGSHESIEIDVRIIAATHRNLADSISQGTFREDLYYRLNVIPLELPALHERGQDILDLAQFFIHQLNASMGTTIVGIEPACQEIFLNYPWPGNVRELSNIVERIAVLKGEGFITAEDLPEKMRDQYELPIGGNLFPFAPESTIAEQLDMKKLVEDFENQLILSALEKFDGNKKKTADYLSMNRTTLIEKLKKRGLA
ncbi:MAG: sigma-54-dependent Fis family transcriptional regulator [Zetaproteobacteria bacterium]|nr:sigma-54-dependent Fis family transcriptional regulator [Zetaproteobacteria bacterium]